MSKLQQLIDELCPEGVEFVKLGEVVKVLSAPYKLNKKEYQTHGKYPIIDQGQEYIIGYTDNEEYLLDDDTYVLFGDHTRNIKFFEGRFAQGADGLKILKAKDGILPRFLFHLMKSLNIKSRGYNRHWSVVVPIDLPLPPLSIQSEIVTILDKFTTLEAELEAELDCRKRQYQYYRDKLLNFKENEGMKVEWKKLGEIGTFTRGKRFVRTDIVEEGVPCIHYGDIYTYYGLQAKEAKTHLTEEKAQKMRFAKKGDVVIVGAGENNWDIGVGVAWMGDEDVAVHDACYIYTSDLDPRYVSHYLRTTEYHLQIRNHVSEGKICSISAQNIGRALIAVPPLPLQQKIADILDRFERLTSDLQDGLPAEIEARRRQYQYYRDKLLTFKRKTN